jgi:TonB family protein
MSCNDVASILDQHRGARLAPAERAQVDLHLSACGDCAAAWHAHTELLALPMPRVPDTLLERVLRASPQARRAERRGARLPVVIGSALLAGAALAAGVTLVSGLRAPASAPAGAFDAEPQAPQGATAPEAQPEQAAAARRAPPSEPPTAVELVETPADVLPLVRANPSYPPKALAEGRDGHVQLRFDITAAGTVENISVVESSDAEFEAPATSALAEWRYLPRIVAGKRVRHDGVHTILRFVLDGGPPPPANPQRDEALEKAQREYESYAAGLVTALDRLAADDLRGVELQLDEMQALYGSERVDLWNFYGYLYTVERNYARAIDAYETAVGIAMRSPRPASGPYEPLAKLYFARHQYDMALKTLLKPQQGMDGAAPPGGTRRVSAEAEALIERLRALGVTEETL